MFGFGSSSAKASAAEEPLRVEGFDAPLRGHRFLVIGDEKAWLRRFNLIESQSLYKGRSILVIQESMGKPSNVSLLGSVGRRRWDIIFRVRESFEAQMVATYVANAPKPIRILWICANAMCEIPRSLWQRWREQKLDVTLIGGSDGTSVSCEWEAILFPHRCPQETVEKVLSARGSGISALAAKMKEHGEEIASSGAALAWSNIEESDTRGSMYWYDPHDGTVNDEYTKKEAALLLEGISKWLAL
jgi:hypothetical protein